MSDPGIVARRFSLWARLGARGAASFDAVGRLLTFRLDDSYYRRGLDNSIVRLRRVAGSAWPWTVERLAAADPTAADPTVADPVLSTLGPALADLADRTDCSHGRSMARRAVDALADGYAADVRSFHATVGPVPIVPPNHSRSVVTRLTEGCQYNACRFCELYRDTPFRVRGADEWRRHVRSVLDYFADGAGIRPHLWIGDASALEAGAETFVDALRVLHEEAKIVTRTPGRGEAHLFKGDDPFLFDGVYAFADAPRAARLEPAAGRQLASLGVRRLYIGVESGSAELLRLTRKAHSPAQVRAAVANLHQAGIAVGLILLVGVGGREAIELHRRATTDLIASLDLGAQDFVFLSPLDVASRATEVGGPTVLEDHDLARETRRLRASLVGAVGRHIRIADYGLEAFVY